MRRMASLPSWATLDEPNETEEEEGDEDEEEDNRSSPSQAIRPTGAPATARHGNSVAARMPPSTQPAPSKSIVTDDPLGRGKEVLAKLNKSGKQISSQSTSHVPKGRVPALPSTQPAPSKSTPSTSTQSITASRQPSSSKLSSDRNRIEPSQMFSTRQVRTVSTSASAIATKGTSNAPYRFTQPQALPSRPLKAQPRSTQFSVSAPTPSRLLKQASTMQDTRKGKGKGKDREIISIDDSDDDAPSISQARPKPWKKTLSAGGSNNATEQPRSASQRTINTSSGDEFPDLQIYRTPPKVQIRKKTTTSKRKEKSGSMKNLGTISISDDENENTPLIDLTIDDDSPPSPLASKDASGTAISNILQSQAADPVVSQAPRVTEPSTPPAVRPKPRVSAILPEKMASRKSQPANSRPLDVSRRRSEATSSVRVQAKSNAPVASRTADYRPPNVVSPLVPVTPRDEHGKKSGIDHRSPQQVESDTASTLGNDEAPAVPEPNFDYEPSDAMDFMSTGDDVDIPALVVAAPSEEVSVQPMDMDVISEQAPLAQNETSGAAETSAPIARADVLRSPPIAIQMEESQAEDVNEVDLLLGPSISSRKGQTASLSMDDEQRENIAMAEEILNKPATLSNKMEMLDLSQRNTTANETAEADVVMDGSESATQAISSSATPAKPFAPSETLERRESHNSTASPRQGGQRESAVVGTGITETQRNELFNAPASPSTSLVPASQSTSPTPKSKVSEKQAKFNRAVSPGAKLALQPTPNFMGMCFGPNNNPALKTSPRKNKPSMSHSATIRIASSEGEMPQIAEKSPGMSRASGSVSATSAEPAESQAKQSPSGSKSTEAGTLTLRETSTSIEHSVKVNIADARPPRKLDLPAPTARKLGSFLSIEKLAELSAKRASSLSVSESVRPSPGTKEEGEIVTNMEGDTNSSRSAITETAAKDADDKTDTMEVETSRETSASLSSSVKVTLRPVLPPRKLNMPPSKRLRSILSMEELVEMNAREALSSPLSQSIPSSTQNAGDAEREKSVTNAAEDDTSVPSAGNAIISPPSGETPSVAEKADISEPFVNVSTTEQADPVVVTPSVAIHGESGIKRSFIDDLRDILRKEMTSEIAAGKKREMAASPAKVESPGIQPSRERNSPAPPAKSPANGKGGGVEDEVSAAEPVGKSSSHWSNKYSEAAIKSAKKLESILPVLTKGIPSPLTNLNRASSSVVKPDSMPYVKKRMMEQTMQSKVPQETASLVRNESTDGEGLGRTSGSQKPVGEVHSKTDASIVPSESVIAEGSSSSSKLQFRKRSISISSSTPNDSGAENSIIGKKTPAPKRPRLYTTDTDGDLIHTEAVTDDPSKQSGRSHRTTPSTLRSRSQSKESSTDAVDFLNGSANYQSDSSVDQPITPVTDLVGAVSDIAITQYVKPEYPKEVGRYFINRDRGPIWYRVDDIPTDLINEINDIPEWAKNPGVLRNMFEAAIVTNTVDDEPEAPIIRIINRVDDEPTPPFEFYYTNRMYHGHGVPPPEYRNLKGCGCIGGCDPRSKTCACLKRQQEIFRQQEVDFPGFVYDDKGRAQIHEYPIFECNDACGCTEDCINRVVQNGRKCPVNIVKTKNKGWGVFAAKKIYRGTFLGIYAGEILVEEEALRRGFVYNKLGRTYLFDIDFWHIPKAHPDDDSKYSIDAFHVGNFSRFLNHSCDPNCKINAVYINEANIEKALLAIFAVKDIDAGQEICFNYYGEVDEDKQAQGEDQGQAYQQCYCGAANCYGKLFAYGGSAE